MSREPDSLEARLFAILAHPRYQPLNKTDLARRLQVPVDSRAGFRKLLQQLEADGRIVRIRKERYVRPADADLITGVLQVNPQGFGYILNESADGLGDVYIAAENMGTALHRDRVIARIAPEEAGEARPPRRRANRSGRIIRILERANETVVGTLQSSRQFFYVVPDEPALVHDIYVRLEGLEKPPSINDKVVVRLEPWEHRHVNPEGKIVEVLGPAKAPGVDILSIIKKHGLITEFPATVLAEAERIPFNVPPAERDRREDLRALPIFTIDPVDARDFDDAIHVAPWADGWEVGIHIADVSFFVRPNSALDREARRRGNSVYFPDRVLPMLPERLSNGVCSLRPDEEHLTKSVFVRLDRHFSIRDYRFSATLISSRRRFTYEQATALLREPAADDFSGHLAAAWNIASHLRRRRFREGALDLDMPEVRVHIDDKGTPIAISREVHDESHQLIEELMLLANETVARATKERMLPSVYRVHDDPDPAKLAEYRETVKAYGIPVGDLTHRREVQRLLDRIADLPEAGALRVGLLRSLRKAIYAAEPRGHYGLAKADYTHFTSPIRRYADLVVHRTLGALIPEPRGKQAMPNSTLLPDLSEHLSETERVAADAEREAVRLKKLEYLQNQLRAPHRFMAAVIEVRNYGLLVELPDLLLSGLVHLSALDQDFFSFDPVRRQLVGRRTRTTYRVGDVLEVRVTRVDTFKQQVDFAVLRKIPREDAPGEPTPPTARLSLASRKKKRGGKGMG
ncbi:MAG TPA: ribonuclease R [Chthoniobacterales bacterium]